MKKSITICFIILSSISHAQIDNYSILLDSAKNIYKEIDQLNQVQIDKHDYEKIFILLQKAIKLNPNSPEARYFLGYTYSRINSRDAQGIIALQLDLLYRASEQFQKVIELTPKYLDEIIVLDPYSKISSEWGSIAMSYLYHQQIDSAKWAFEEGKKRGGFGEFILALNRKILDECSQNAILISSGDNFTIPLWYLQTIENYRPDVSVIDISLLNTIWYPKFLSSQKSISFDIQPQSLDTVSYIYWNDKLIKIAQFSWILTPSYADQYLLRGDRIFLSLLKKNKFERDIYFTIGFDEALRLNLNDHIKSFIIVEKLMTSSYLDLNYKEYSDMIKKYLNFSELLNTNSTDEVKLFDNLRYHLLGKTNDYLLNNEIKKAKGLINILDQYVNEDKYPYHNPQGKKYADDLRLRIKEATANH